MKGHGVICLGVRIYYERSDPKGHGVICLGVRIY